MALLLLSLMAAELHAQSEVARTRETEGLHGPVRRVEYVMSSPIAGEERAPRELRHSILMFDTAGRLIEEVIAPWAVEQARPGSRTMYRYDDSGRLASSEHFVLTSRYDRETRTVRVDTLLPERFSYQYRFDREGRVVEQSRWLVEHALLLSARIEFTYDDSGRPASTVSTEPETGVRRETTWERNATGSVVTLYESGRSTKPVVMQREVRDTAGNLTTRFTFDPNRRSGSESKRLVLVEEFRDGRLTVRRGARPESSGERLEYIVDEYGNWTARRRAGSTPGRGIMEKRTIEYEDAK